YSPWRPRARASSRSLSKGLSFANAVAKCSIAVEPQRDPDFKPPSIQLRSRLRRTFPSRPHRARSSTYKNVEVDSGQEIDWPSQLFAPGVCAKKPCVRVI